MDVAKSGIRLGITAGAWFGFNKFIFVLSVLSMSNVSLFVILRSTV